MAANPFSGDFAVYRNPGKSRTTASVRLPKIKARDLVASLPKPKPLPKQPPRGGWKELGQAAASSLVQTPGGAVDLVKMLPGAAEAVGDYFGSHTPGEVWDDTKGFVGSIPGRIAEDPGLVVDMIPGIGDVKGIGEMLRESADLRAAGDVETAQALERITGPVSALTLLPELGMSVWAGRGARAAKRAELAAMPDRPRYITSEEGPYLNVRREGLEPDIVPQMATAKNIDEMRSILANPETNPARRVANEYTTQELGRPFDPGPAPVSSLERQGGIGRVYELAASDNPEYKHRVYEAYGNAYPEVVEKSGAQNYDQLTEAAYNALADKTVKQFDRLPVPMRYHFGEGEYSGPTAMLRDAFGRGNLNVFRGGDPHPYLGRTDPVSGLTYNEMFRAAHDYLGHGATGSDFNAPGEEIAYGVHAATMDPLEQMALLSETRGQNSWVNYGPANADLTLRMNTLRDERDVLRGLPRDSFAFKARGGVDRLREIGQELGQLGGQTIFAPNRPLLIPPEYMDAASPGGVPDYLRDLITPKNPVDNLRGVHLSTTPGLTRTDPAFYGTGHRGDDWALRGKRGSPAQHTSFYTGPEGTVVPEGEVAAVAPHAYQTKLSGLYDINADPDKLVQLSRAYNIAERRAGNELAHIPDLTRLINEYGYSGYHNPDFMGEGRGAANMFGPVDNLEAIMRGERGYAQGGPVEVKLAAASPQGYATGGRVEVRATGAG